MDHEFSELVFELCSLVCSQVNSVLPHTRLIDQLGSFLAWMLIVSAHMSETNHCVIVFDHGQRLPAAEIAGCTYTLAKICACRHVRSTRYAIHVLCPNASSTVSDCAPCRCMSMHQVQP
jgi:hypothetical protein